MSLLLTYILKFQIMSDNDYDYEFSDVRVVATLNIPETRTLILSLKREQLVLV